MQACELSTGRRSDLLIYVAWDLSSHCSTDVISRCQSTDYELAD
jgi:hypothetical protein